MVMITQPLMLLLPLVIQHDVLLTFYSLSLYNSSLQKADFVVDIWSLIVDMLNKPFIDFVCLDV